MSGENSWDVHTVEVGPEELFELLGSRRVSVAEVKTIELHGVESYGFGDPNELIRFVGVMRFNTHGSGLSPALHGLLGHPIEPLRFVQGQGKTLSRRRGAHECPEPSAGQSVDDESH